MALIGFYFLARRNILATNQIARKTIEPFKNNNKRSQGPLGEGGPLSTLFLFVNILNFYHLKRIFTQKWLDHLLLMTSYLVTVVNDSHQTWISVKLLKTAGADDESSWKNSRKTL